MKGASMLIEWNIAKKAGYRRPKLRYRVTLEPFEIDLAVPMVRITSTIPKPVDAWRSHRRPTASEPHTEEAEDVYPLFTPSHESGTCEEVLILPMRKDNHYPEIEASFRQLRQAYEDTLITAYENSAFEKTGRLEMTLDTKQRIVAGITANRFMEVITKAS
jgi:hypothetical protein